MKKMLHQFKVILKKSQIKSLFFLFLGALFVALLDTASVALMAPFMTLLTDLGGYEDSVFGKIMISLFNVESTERALILLSVGFIILYLVRGVCKIGYNFWQARLMALCRTDLSTRLFNYVMHKPYSYHLQHNTAETQRLVSSDVTNCFFILDHLMLCLASLLVSIGILAVLIVLNWQLTLVLILVMIVFVIWIKHGLKKIINKYADLKLPC